MEVYTRVPQVKRQCDELWENNKSEIMNRPEVKECFNHISKILT